MNRRKPVTAVVHPFGTGAELRRMHHFIVGIEEGRADELANAYGREVHLVTGPALADRPGENEFAVMLHASDILWMGMIGQTEDRNGFLYNARLVRPGERIPEDDRDPRKLTLFNNSRHDLIEIYEARLEGDELGECIHRMRVDTLLSPQAELLLPRIDDIEARFAIIDKVRSFVERTTPDPAKDRDDQEEPATWENHYIHCGEEWSLDGCDSMHNDRCPCCNGEIEPYRCVLYDRDGEMLDETYLVSESRLRELEQSLTASRAAP